MNKVIFNSLILNYICGQNFEGMENWMEDTARLLGEEKLNLLKGKNVLVVGLGAIGIYTAEMIARAGIGAMTIVDRDMMDASQISPQLASSQSTEEQSKSQRMAARLQDINPEIKLKFITQYIPEEEIEQLVNDSFDYVVDAMDALSPKVHLIKACIDKKVRLISSMGVNGKTDPAKVEISDLSESYNCKLARTLRKHLRQLHIKTSFPVVFSHEQINMEAVVEAHGELNQHATIGTVPYMPALFGIHCASKVIRDLAGL